MARIIGIDGLTHEQVNAELARGARFVVYQYCISIVVMSFRRSSNVHFVRADENRLVRGLGFVAVTAVLGWWGIPWGPIFSLQSLATNFGGGKDVTDAVLSSLNNG